MKYLLIAAFWIGLSTTVLAGNFYHVPQQIIVQQKTVQFDAGHFLGIPGYYSTINNIKQERQLESDNALKAENDALRAQIELLIKLCTAGQKPPVDTKPDEPHTPPEKPPVDEPAVGGDQDTGDYEVTELDQKVYGIFKTKCANCHSETSPKGDWGNGEPVVLYKKATDTLLLQPLENRAFIHELVRRVNLDDKGLSAMPPGGPLPDADVEVLYQWMQEEASRFRQGD